MENVIVDFKRKSRRSVPAGAFYTGVTCVRSLNNLYLRNFEESHIRTDSRVKEQIEQLKDKPYVFLKWFLNQPCFENFESELKISYLNINGIASHLEDISADRNLLNSDILVFSEAKLKKRSDNVCIPQFECLASLSSGSEISGGMMLFCKHEVKDLIKINEMQHISFDSGYLEYIQIIVKCKKYSFVYFHPNFSSKSLQWIKEEIKMLTQSSGIRY